LELLAQKVSIDILLAFGLVRRRPVPLHVFDYFFKYSNDSNFGKCVLPLFRDDHVGDRIIIQKALKPLVAAKWRIGGDSNRLLSHHCCDFVTRAEIANFVEQIFTLRF
jgi:hypothetical protein